MIDTSEKLIRILLVDDDEDDYVLTRYLFEEFKSSQYDLEWTKDYDEGLESAKNNLHDVYLVDFRLGEKDGLQFLFQAAGYGCTAPIILLTGQGDKEIDMQAMQAGAADYLIKGGFDAPSLERSIRYSIRHARTISKLKTSELKFRSVIQSASDAIFLVDSMGKVTMWNSAAEKIFGYSEKEIIGQSATVLMGAKYAKKSMEQGVSNTMNFVLKPLMGKVIEASGRRKDGSEFPVEMSGSVWQTPEGSFYTGIIRDITKRREAEYQLVHEATHDSLTGLPNRSQFTEILEHAIKHNSGENRFAVLFLDLDRFKIINDGLGHIVGDKLLIAIAERLTKCLRASDRVARFGGDEFTILANNLANPNEAILLAERLQNELAKPFEFNGQEVFTSVSIGITYSNSSKRLPEDFLRDADTAMYCAKGGGKARYQVFDSKMHENSLSLLKKESDLRRAIERDEFKLYYQPIHNLQTNEITEFEALIRWEHPEKGLVSPADFIPIAEETGLIISIGKWVLEESCRQMSIWQKEFPHFPDLGISINLSAKQLLQGDFAKQLELILQESGISASRVKLEVTESSVMENADTALKILREFKKLGVRISSDDFGTGYSSLSYLNKFPFDSLKIDRSFVGKIDSDAKSEEIIRAILRLAENLNLEVVAEGIETVDQLNRLMEFGCVYGQGFYFSKPVISQTATDLLIASPNRILSAGNVNPSQIFESLEIQ
jgi:diguanylate cyclase (GGDEF)-like protein/PAS domain S-box-containing protein